MANITAFKSQSSFWGHTPQRRGAKSISTLSRLQWAAGNPTVGECSKLLLLREQPKPRGSLGWVSCLQSSWALPCPVRHRTEPRECWGGKKCYQRKPAQSPGAVLYWQYYYILYCYNYIIIYYIKYSIFAVLAKLWMHGLIVSCMAYKNKFTLLLNAYSWISTQLV